MICPCRPFRLPNRLRQAGEPSSKATGWSPNAEELLLQDSSSDGDRAWGMRGTGASRRPPQPPLPPWQPLQAPPLIPRPLSSKQPVSLPAQPPLPPPPLPPETLPPLLPETLSLLPPPLPPQSLPQLPPLPPSCPPVPPQQAWDLPPLPPQPWDLPPVPPQPWDLPAVPQQPWDLLPVPPQQPWDLPPMPPQQTLQPPLASAAEAHPDAARLGAHLSPGSFIGAEMDALPFPPPPIPLPPLPPFQPGHAAVGGADSLANSALGAGSLRGSTPDLPFGNTAMQPQLPDPAPLGELHVGAQGGWSPLAGQTAWLEQPLRRQPRSRRRAAAHPPPAPPMPPLPPSPHLQQGALEQEGCGLSRARRSVRAAARTSISYNTDEEEEDKMKSDSDGDASIGSDEGSDDSDFLGGRRQKGGTRTGRGTPRQGAHMQVARLQTRAPARRPRAAQPHRASVQRSSRKVAAKWSASEDEEEEAAVSSASEGERQVRKSYSLRATKRVVLAESSLEEEEEEEEEMEGDIGWG